MEFYFNVDPILVRSSGANHEIGRYTSSHVNQEFGFWIWVPVARVLKQVEWIGPNEIEDGHCRTGRIRDLQSAKNRRIASRLP